MIVVWRQRRTSGFVFGITKLGGGNLIQNQDRQKSYIDKIVLCLDYTALAGRTDAWNTCRHSRRLYWSIVSEYINVSRVRSSLILFFVSLSDRFFPILYVFSLPSCPPPVLRPPANSIIYPAATQTLRSRHGTFSDLFHNRPLNDGGHPVDPGTIVAFFAARKSWADPTDER